MYLQKGMTSIVPYISFVTAAYGLLVNILENISHIINKSSLDHIRAVCAFENIFSCVSQSDSFYTYFCLKVERYFDQHLFCL